MGLSMYKLDFDPAAPTESDRIGSFLIGAGGTVIASTGTSLDTNVTNTVTVSGTDIDIRDLAFATDSVTAHQGGSWTVTATATDFDIRNIVNTQDSIAIGDSTNIANLQRMDSAFTATPYGFATFGIRQDAAGSPVSADGDAHPFVFNNDGELKVAADLTSDVADDAVDTGNPIKMGTKTYGATLAAVSAAGDRANLAADIYRRTHVNDSANIATLSTRTGVTDTAALVVASSLAGRKKMTVQNISNTNIYLGGSAVTASGAAQGLLVKKGDSYTEAIGAGCSLYAIAGSAGPHNIIVLELA